MPEHNLFFPLVARPAMVPLARHRVVAQVVSWDEAIGSEARDGLELAVAELVTNAIRHTDAVLVLVRVTLAGHLLRLEVFDGSPTIPTPKPETGGDAENGRGLQLVALVADRCGHEPTRRGKVAWAEFDLPPLSRPAARAGLLQWASRMLRPRLRTLALHTPAA
jgi:serine/threonine-protein kinase RsbW